MREDYRLSIIDNVYMHHNTVVVLRMSTQDLLLNFDNLVSQCTQVSSDGLGKHEGNP